MQITEQDNIILNMFKGKLDTTKKQIEIEVKRQKFYKEAEDKEIDTAVERIYKKLQIVNSEYL